MIILIQAPSIIRSRASPQAQEMVLYHAGLTESHCRLLPNSFFKKFEQLLRSKNILLLHVCDTFGIIDL